MITRAEALRRIRSHVPAPRAVELGILEAVGHVAAREVRVPFDLPRWDLSAMDGYALRPADTRGASPQSPAKLKISGVVRAGRAREAALEAGECVAIMTGAPLPKGADAVLIREEAVVRGGFLLVARGVKRGSHVRRRGEEVRRGALVIRKGERIHDGTVAALASVGRARVRVWRRPRVALLVTGDELVCPGETLAPGQIYDSNSFALLAALRQNGYAECLRLSAPDRLEPTVRALKRALVSSDLVLICGGVSVGDYDCVKEALERVGARRVFWKVDQKPGKPLYFGVASGKPVFGLPGNPTSAYFCFYLYALAALGRMSGERASGAAPSFVKLASALEGGARGVTFLKSRITAGRGDARARILKTQGSGHTIALHRTDAILAVPGGGRFKKNHTLDAVLLPGRGK